MSNQPLIQITFGLSDPELDDAERLDFAQQALAQLRCLEQVDYVEPIEELPSLRGAKGFETLVGFLTADLSLPNLAKFVRWMSDRFADQPLRVRVKVGTQEIELEAKSRKELADLEQVAMSLMARMKQTEIHDGNA